MKYEIIFQKAAQKFLRKQDSVMRKRLLQAIYQLPEGTDIKKLQGYDLYRMRIGTIRIIYSIDNVVRIISIENIDNRGDIYKRY
ncbi:MAG: type II toxin-antitoxin system RelE/ParE family toxin [Lachnospiraceae bacterium]|nr:type II toxin-antitoxin system RelE/ParE family toxin [Lachnospiraceae bacterium]